MNKPIRYSWITDYFKDDPSTLQRGKVFLSSNKLREFSFECVDNFGQIKAAVESSFRPNVLHQVKLSFLRQGEKGFCNVHCDCVRGDVLCSHIACTMLHAEKTISKTDVPVLQSIPRSSQVNVPSEVLFQRQENATSLYSTNCHLENSTTIYRLLADKISSTSAPMKHSLFSRLTPYAPPPATHVALPEYLPFQRIINNLDGDTIKNITLMKEKMKATTKDVEDVEKVTVCQASNPLWKSYRFCRITASRCKQAIVSMNRTQKTVTESYLNILLNKNKEMVKNCPIL